MCVLWTKRSTIVITVKKSKTRVFVNRYDVCILVRLLPLLPLFAWMWVSKIILSFRTLMQNSIFCPILLAYNEINEKASLYQKLHFATVCRLCTSLYYFLILLKNFFQYPLSTEKTYEGIYFQKVTMWKLQLVKKKKKSEILL